MKRFFMVAAFAASFGTLLSIKSTLPILFVLITVLILAVFAVLLYKKYKLMFLQAVICFLVILPVAFFYSRIYTQTRCDSVVALAGKNLKITATIAEEPDINSNYFIYYIKTSKIGLNNAPQKVKLRLVTYKKLDADCFDTITATVKFKRLNNLYASNYNADGIFVAGSSDNITVTKNNSKPLFYYAIKLRQNVKSYFKNNLNTAISGIPSALLTGDKDNIGEKFYSDIKATGMAHIMAVSGLHISIICMTVVELLKKLRFSKKLYSVIGLLIVLLISAVAGFSGSVMRAGLMYFLIFSGNLFSRRTDALNSLGFAAVILIIINPYNILGLSFLLSAFSTLGIVVLSPKLVSFAKAHCKFKGSFKKLFLYIFEVIAVSVSANIFILPICFKTFGFTSVLSPVINLVLSAPTALCIWFSLLSLIFSFVPVLSKLLLMATGMLSYILKAVISTFAQFKYIGFRSDDVMFYAFSVLLFIIIIILFIFKKHKAIVICLSALLIVSLPLSLIFQDYINSKKYEFYFIESNSGQSMIIKKNNHCAVIAASKDYETRYEIESFLDSHFLDKIDLFISPVYEQKIISSLREYEDQYKISKLVTNQIDAKDGNLNLDNCRINLWNDINISSIKSGDKYNLIIKCKNESIGFDSSGDFSGKTDYIATENPLLSYKINGNSSRYIISGDYSDAVNAAHDIYNSGGFAAVTTEYGTVKATKYGNSLLKFKRE